MAAAIASATTTAAASTSAAVTTTASAPTSITTTSTTPVSAAAFTAPIFSAAFATGAEFGAFTFWRAELAAVAIAFGARRALCGLGGHFVRDAKLFIGSFPAELHAVVLIDVDDEHLHFITHATNIADGVDVTGRKLADVNQSVTAGQDFDKGAEILDAGDAAVVNLADLDGGGAGLDLGEGRLGPFAVAAGDGSQCLRH